MAVVVTPYSAELIPAVKEFNGRLRSRGVSITFPECDVPTWLPKVNGREIYHEYYLALEGNAVRGAYVLKFQPFAVNGVVTRLAEYRLQISEGQIDNRYASVGVQIYLDALQREPRLYTIGIGGYQENAAQLLIRAGWSTWLVPFHFRVLRSARFLQNIAYLRSTTLRRLALDVLTASGLGTIATAGAQYFKTRKLRKPWPRSQSEQVTRFDSWADDVWQSVYRDYSLVAVRDSSILNVLYPADDSRWIRLRIKDGSNTVGWAVLLNVPMKEHNYFGNMRVGSLIDCLAVPGFEFYITSAALHYLMKNGADVAVTNLSDRRWRAALDAAGFCKGPSNFILATSKQVSNLLCPFDVNKERAHMTRADGGGPQNLLAVRK